MINGVSKMIKSASVLASDIGKYNRMDAEFHTAVTKLKESHGDRLKELEESFTSSEIVEKLIDLRTEDLQCLKPLARRDGKDRKDFISAIEEYPYLAALMIEINLPEISKNTKQRLDAAQQYLNKLDGLLDKKTKKDMKP